MMLVATHDPGLLLHDRREQSFRRTARAPSYRIDQVHFSLNISGRISDTGRVLRMRCNANPVAALHRKFSLAFYDVAAIPSR
jgi:hypothetical protein